MCEIRRNGLRLSHWTTQPEETSRWRTCCGGADGVQTSVPTTGFRHLGRRDGQVAAPAFRSVNG